MENIAVSRATGLQGQMIPVRQSEALRTGALTGAGQVGAVVGTARGLLTALVNILTATVSQQTVAALTAALTTQHSQMTKYHSQLSPLRY